MDQFPTLSIVIPSWNQGRFIKRTLLSILNQDYPSDIQIIVSDGGSTDETVEILRSFGDRIIWWSERDKGFVDAVMKGAAKATGKILAIQSSDDYYLPGAFRAMARAFQQSPNAGFVSGGECAIDLSGNIINHSSPIGEINPATILYKTIPPQHASFIRRELYEKVGGLRTEVDMCADIDLWYRAAHLQPGIYFPDIIAVYQLHPDQRTVVSDKWFPSLVKMVESCQDIPEYRSVFNLSDKQKMDLYSYWEMNWTTKRDISEGKKVALRKVLHVFRQRKRTNRMMLGILFPESIKLKIKSLLPKRKEHIILSKLQQTIQTTWCD